MVFALHRGEFQNDELEAYQTYFAPKKAFSTIEIFIAQFSYANILRNMCGFLEATCGTKCLVIILTYESRTMITTIDGRMSPNLETPKQKNYEQRQIKYKKKFL